jgi:ribosome biogenesis protein ERB1
MMKISFQNIIKSVVWHQKGDYFATMAHNIQSSLQIMINSLSKASAQRPFSQAKGIVQAMAFHPTKPHFFIATHQTVFQYNLQK